MLNTSKTGKKKHIKGTASVLFHTYTFIQPDTQSKLDLSTFLIMHTTHKTEIIYKCAFEKIKIEVLEASTQSKTLMHRGTMKGQDDIT